jgi:hypothetical protein
MLPSSLELSSLPLRYDKIHIKFQNYDIIKANFKYIANWPIDIIFKPTSTLENFDGI